MSKKKIIIASVCGALVLAAAATTAVVLTRHKHTYDWKVVKEATCVEEGLEEYTCLGEKGCGDVTDSRAIAALGHTESDWYTVGEGTCTEPGSEAKKCTVCGEVLDTREVEALGHREGEWVTTLEPTCEETGLEILPCTVCNETLEMREVAKLGHDYPSEWTIKTDATCITNGSKIKVCSRCEKEVASLIPATGHKFGAWVTDKPATCTENGTQKRVCTECKNSESRVVEATGHMFGEWKTTVAATVASEGKMERTCVNCGEKESKAIAKLTPPPTSGGNGGGTTSGGSGSGTGTGNGITQGTVDKNDIGGKVGDVITIPMYCWNFDAQWEGPALRNARFKILGKDQYGIYTLQIIDNFSPDDTWYAGGGMSAGYSGQYYWYNGMLATVEDNINHLCEHNSMLLVFDRLYKSYGNKVGTHVDKSTVTCTACGASKTFDNLQPFPDGLETTLAPVDGDQNTFFYVYQGDCSEDHAQGDYESYHNGIYKHQYEGVMYTYVKAFDLRHLEQYHDDVLIMNY